MIAAQGGIFGWVTDSRRLIAALGSLSGGTPRAKRRVQMGPHLRSGSPSE